MIQISSECQSSVVCAGEWVIWAGVWRPNCSDHVWRLAALTPDILNVTLHPQSIIYNYNYGHNTGENCQTHLSVAWHIELPSALQVFQHSEWRAAAFFWRFQRNEWQNKNDSIPQRPPAAIQTFSEHFNWKLEQRHALQRITRFERVLN